MTNQVKLASFKEAFEKFLSYCDDEAITPEAVATFATLKAAGKIRVENEPEFWHGNHCRAESTVELFLVEEPTRFHVVRYCYWETGTQNHGENDVVHTHIFVPQ